MDTAATRGDLIARLTASVRECAQLRLRVADLERQLAERDALIAGYRQGTRDGIVEEEAPTSSPSTSPMVSPRGSQAAISTQRCALIIRLFSLFLSLPN